MSGPRVVLDTNVLVAAIRSRKGAAFRVLSLVGRGKFDVAVSVPLVLEYEDTLLRHCGESGLSRSDVGDLIDYVCAVGKPQDIFFLWRPVLKDPKDDMVLEVAVAAGCDAIVTYNIQDFAGCETLRVRTISPADLLREIGELP